MTDLDGRHRVQSLCSGPAVYVHGSDTLEEVARTLATNDMGVALVRGVEQEFEGLVSERDLVRVVADGGDLETTRADEVMTEDVVTIPRGAEISEAMRQMVDAAIRHLVVMDSDDRPMGVVSSRDLLRAYAAGDV